MGEGRALVRGTIVMADGLDGVLREQPFAEDDLGRLAVVEAPVRLFPIAERLTGSRIEGRNRLVVVAGDDLEGHDAHRAQQADGVAAALALAGVLGEFVHQDGGEKGDATQAVGRDAIVLERLFRELAGGKGANQAMNFPEADAGHGPIDRGHRLAAAVSRAVGHADQARGQGRVLLEEIGDVAGVGVRVADEGTQLDEQARCARQFLRSVDDVDVSNSNRNHDGPQSAQKDGNEWDLAVNGVIFGRISRGIGIWFCTEAREVNESWICAGTRATFAVQIHGSNWMVPWALRMAQDVEPRGLVTFCGQMRRDSWSGVRHDYPE